MDQSFDFAVVGSYKYSRMYTQSAGAIRTLMYVLASDGAVYSKYDYGSSSWADTNTKNIILTADQYVSADFYNWFTSNTTKTS